MEYKLSNMCDWERKKAVFLMGVAEDLGINTSSYGEIAVNPNSGYTYFWSKDYNFSLYMPINCELVKSDIVALWTNSNDGEEREFNLTEETTLEDIENWAAEQEKTVKEE
jgi:hypothetical protein